MPKATVTERRFVIQYQQIQAERWYDLPDGSDGEEGKARKELRDHRRSAALNNPSLRLRLVERQTVDLVLDEQEVAVGQG